MSEWSTHPLYASYETLVSDDDLITLIRKKGNSYPPDHLMELTQEFRDELKAEYGRFAFADLKVELEFHESYVNGTYAPGSRQAEICVPIGTIPELPDVLLVDYSRYVMPEQDCRRMHELFIRDGCGDTLTLDETCELTRHFVRTREAWEASYGEVWDDVLYDLFRHESIHHLQTSMPMPFAVAILQYTNISAEQFVEWETSKLVREGFAHVGAHKGSSILSQELSTVFRTRLEKLFTPELESGPYGKFMNTIDPNMTDFAGEYLATTIVDAFGEEAMKECITSLDKKTVIAQHLKACENLRRVPLFDYISYPYYGDIQ